MTYDDFAERFLAALYLETEEGGKEFHRSAELLKKYKLEPKPHWIGRLADDWEHSYLKGVSKTLGGYDGWSFRISAAGMSKVENDFIDISEIAEFLEVAPNQSVGPAADTVQSSSWTGLPSNFQLTASRRDELVCLLAKAEGDLDSIGAGNSEKAFARSYIVAAKALADAPDPPVDLIWEIINRANALSGIASLFVSILALFTAAN